MAAFPPLIGAILLGVAVARALRDRPAMERACLGLLVAIATMAALSLALTRLQWFGAWPVAGALALAAAVVLRVRPPTPDDAPFDRWDGATLLVLGGLGTLYALFPTKYLLGGRDPGPYLAFAAHIGRTGGLDLDLPVLAELVGKVGDLVRLDAPAIYSEVGRGLGDDPTQRIPQFQHLFPALAAHGWLAAGVDGIARVNAWVTVAALWVIRQLMVDRIGKAAGLAVVLVMGLNPALVWAARITLTEPLSILLLFGSLMAVDLARHRQSTPGYGLAGALAGLTVFARLDGVLAVLAILPLAAFCAAGYGVRRRDARALVLGYALVATGGLADGYVHSFPYLSDLWNLGQLDKLIALHTAGVLLGLGLTFTPSAAQRVLAVTTRGAFGLGVGLAGGWLAYAWFSGDPSSKVFEERAIHELAWYVTPLAYPLGILGAARCVADRNKLLAWGPVVCLTVSTLFIFTWRPSITPDHIWASRRWLPHVVPGLSMLSVVAVAWLAARAAARSKLLAGALAVAALAYSLQASVRFARPFLFRTMFEGIERNYEHLARTLAREGVVLTDNHHVASILTHVYEVPTVLVNRPRDAWRRSEAEALAGIPFVGLHPRPTWTTLHTRLRVGGPFLERTWRRPPEKVKHRPYGAHLGVIDPNYASGEKAFEFIASDLGVGIGRYDHDLGLLRSKGGEGSLQYGPYARVPKGRYRVVWYGTVEKAGRIDVDVASGAGKKKHAFAELDVQTNPERDVIAGLSFAVGKDTPGVEFRLFIRGAQVSIERIEVHRAE